MDGDACSARCGWCGRCDSGLRNGTEANELKICDRCGADRNGRTVHGIHGAYCSLRCYEAAEVWAMVRR